jgi:SAM-dependent methyltransferase/GNAT superfamily N-acetyltransferase
MEGLEGPMISIIDLEFNWIPGTTMTSVQLDACAELYSSHYGIWSMDASHRPGKRITLRSDRLREFLSTDDSWAALAYHQDELIAYAFAVRGDLGQSRTVTWVTQLVVHDDYRNRDVAKRLLSSLWGFSDHYAWGLVTSNPYAVRALEKATGRRCDPAVIQQHAQDIHNWGAERITYVANKKLSVDQTASILDTEFYVSHAELSSMLQRATETVSWTLGRLGEGQEWFAFTFGHQKETAWTQEDLVQMFTDADRTVRQAYARMKLDHGHKWTRHTESEVNHIIEALNLTHSSQLLDVGCGSGRHLLELGARGYSGLGVDFVGSLIQRANDQAYASGIHERISFSEADSRILNLGESFDAILCLYDVIGTFPDDKDNDAIIASIARHLRVGGRALISVMNLELTEHQAIHTADVMQHPEALTALPPGRIMQDTGNIFNPKYYLLDPTTSIVYRKEQFDEGQQLPAELIVRDRRYRRDELIQKFADVGIELIACTYVQLGHWDTPLDAHDHKAKEILFLGKKKS